MWLYVSHEQFDTFRQYNVYQDHSKHALKVKPQLNMKQPVKVIFSEKYVSNGKLWVEIYHFACGLLLHNW